ncbi:MAG: hypothetical protein HN757_03320 [Calditrichaeota bacterium]|jgi:hypothetical protein|nr:hypothetical protein [Calditrichota bacterium]
MAQYRVLVLEKTKAGIAHCVGGITDKHKGIRLLNSPDFPFWDASTCPFSIGRWFFLEANPHIDQNNPHHTENTVVEQVLEESQLNETEDIISFLQNGKVIRNCVHPTDAFKFDEGNNAFYKTSSSIFEVSGLYLGKLLQSKTFWINPHPLRLVEDRYHCSEGNYFIKYVGVEFPVRIIPKNSIIQLSISSYWSENDASFLQLSGWLI